MAEPLIDIVMLISKQGTWSDLAIRAVEHHTKNPYKLWIVDQAVTDPNVKAVINAAKSREHTVVYMAENRSFSNGNNAGIRAGSAKYVVILNDDAIVAENWDGAFIQDLSDKSVGLVAARTNYAAGPSGDPGFVGDPPWVAFVCVGFRREIFESVVGPMDEENFTGFAAEDLDYCFQIRKAGLKIKLSNAYVLHAGSRSIPVLTSGGSKDAEIVRASYNAHNEKYNRVLVEKWGKDFVTANTKLKQKVLVTSYHAEHWTRVRFAGALLTLKAGSSSGVAGGGPDGGNFGFTYYQHVRTPIHLARQLVCDYALKEGYDVLVQIDDDATFNSDLIRRLLSHNKEVVTTLAYQRKPPYLPCVYERTSQDAVVGNPMENLEQTGLRKVDISGFHVSALRLSVIRKMRDYRSTKFPAGITEYWGGWERAGEDFCFCRNLVEIGVPLYCDTDIIVGHIGEEPVIDQNYRRLYRDGKAQ